MIKHLIGAISAGLNLSPTQSEEDKRIEWVANKMKEIQAEADKKTEWVAKKMKEIEAQYDPNHSK